MIVGIGTDIVDIQRIARAMDRHGDRFLARCFTPYEIKRAEAKNDHQKAAFLAKRFAAKEACAKAMGMGFTGVFALSDIGVEENAAGAPFLVLQPPAREALQGLIPQGTLPRVHLSLSDERGYALAFVTIEALAP